MVNQKTTTNKPKAEAHADVFMTLKLPISFSHTPRAVLGVIQVATDLTMDMEGALMISKFSGVEIRCSKIPLKNEDICLETYTDAYQYCDISNAIRTLSLHAMDLMTVKSQIKQWGISCTSISFLLGRELLGKCFPADAQWTDMYQGVIEALSAVTDDLPGRSLAVLTPYTWSISQKNHEVLEYEGFPVKVSMSLDIDLPAEISAISAAYITECVVKMCADKEVDAVFIGSNSFRACMPEFIDALEA